MYVSDHLLCIAVHDSDVSKVTKHIPGSNMTWIDEPSVIRLYPTTVPLYTHTQPLNFKIYHSIELMELVYLID